MSSTQTSRQLDDRYVVERALGTQAEGRFFLGVDTHAGGRVTIFLPNLEGRSPGAFLEALTPELKRCAPLKDTPYCTLVDAGLTRQGEAFVVVARPRGRSLAEHLRVESRLTTSRALSVGIQLCDLVRRAHAAIIFPAPLDPGHVILDPQSGGRFRVSLVDPGLQRGAYDLALDQISELGRGATRGPRDDVFSLTALLHLMIFGVNPPPMSVHGPADGSGWMALPEIGRTLDPRLEACLHTVLLKGLAPDPGERFAHAEALQRALTGLRQLMSLSAPAFELLAATRGRLGRRPDPFDLTAEQPEQARATEARALIRQVASTSPGNATSLGRISQTSESHHGSTSGEAASDERWAPSDGLYR
ncbi:MAG: hypothetical protein ACE366_11690 [Bradymonadia bacterium]